MAPLNGNLMYEMARLRMAEQGRSARQAGETRGRIAAALSRRGRRARPEAAGDTIPAQRHEEARGRSARTGR